MISLIKKIKDKNAIKFTNILIFIFFISLLSFKKGYSYVPLALGGIGLIYTIFQKYIYNDSILVSQEKKIFTYTIFFYFITVVASIIVHQDSLRELDNPIKLLLLIPAILLLSRYPIHFKTLLYSIPTGAAIAGSIAIYQKFYLGHGRTFISYMSIQAGDIAITLAFLSLAVSLYLYQQKESAYSIVLCVVASLLGFTASGLSNARGGWIALPVILTCIVFYNKSINKKFLLGVFFSLFTIIVILYSIPKTSIADKIGHIRTQTTLYLEKNKVNTSVGARLEMWKSAILGIKEKPLLGWGKKGYMELKKEQARQRTISPSILSFNDAHNQYIDVWVKRGLFGVLGLLSLFIIPLHYFYKITKRGKEKHRLIASFGIYHIISTMIFCLTQSFLNHSSGAIFYIFMLILFYTNTQENRQL